MVQIPVTVDGESTGTAYANITDLQKFWKAIEASEQDRANYLLDLTSDLLRQIALNSRKNLDTMITDQKVMESTVKLITMEAVKRAMLTPLNQPPVNQMSQTAGPYAETFVFSNPAGDIWFKDKELKMLGLKKQKLSSVSTSRTNIYSREESL